ncbi:right-handed parallel beta-helix repeat-containing protein, partial [bacterium]|nr:right-handed parallel beta-helix repeat-containing protein [bacterium]
LASTPSSTSEIPFKRGDIRSWPEMEDNRIVILLRWRSAYNAIERVDEQKRIAWLRTPEDGPGGHNGLLVVPPRYFVENIKALLDSPGEWFYDKTKNEISYLAPAGLTNPNAAILSVPQINRLIQVQGEENRPVRNLRFYNLIFEGAKENFRTFPHHYEATPGCIAVSFEYAHDCEFANSELRACGGVGMEIGFGCCQTRVFGNRFDGLEQGALAILGTGDGANGKLCQMNRETRVTGNIFSNCGQGGGITLSAFHTLRTTISHNYFTKTGRPYTMDVGGGGLEGNSNGECIVEYNHFDDVQTDADDAGVIVVNGMTYNSTIRNNLIHGVERGFFSDNVAFWFDNMSSGWRVENNLYYDLEQGAMKTCGTYLIDNVYQNNFTIEPPANAPEQFIHGDPDCSCSQLQLLFKDRPLPAVVQSGSLLKARAEVYNNASSGITTLTLYANRKPMQTQPFPIIRHNRRTIEFDFRLNEPGLYEISINETEPQIVTVQGLKPAIVYDKLLLSEQRVLAGQPVQISAVATNLQSADLQVSIPLLANGKKIQTHSLTLKAGSTQPISFDITPQPGDHAIQVGNSEIQNLQ